MPILPYHPALHSVVYKVKGSDKLLTAALLLHTVLTNVHTETGVKCRTCCPDNTGFRVTVVRDHASAERGEETLFLVTPIVLSSPYECANCSSSWSWTLAESLAWESCWHIPHTTLASHWRLFRVTLEGVVLFPPCKGQTLTVYMTNNQSQSNLAVHQKQNLWGSMVTIQGQEGAVTNDSIS